jgi:hypothetical protein
MTKTKMQEGSAWELRFSAIGATFILILTLGFQASEDFSEWGFQRGFQASEGFKQGSMRAGVWDKGLRPKFEATQRTQRNNSNNFKKQLKE